MDPLPLTAAYLTDVLRRNGILGDADSVRHIGVDSPLPALVSHVLRLRPDYGGFSGAPPSFILKTSRPDRQSTLEGHREISFWREVAPHSPSDLLPKCYDTNLNSETGAWHLLTEDLGDTHFLSPRWPLPPTEAQWRAILTAWARFHAAWWDDPRLGVSIGRRHDESMTAAYVRDSAAHFAHFADLLGDRLPPARRLVFERYLDAVPDLFGRLRTHRDLTIVHGDAHAWNVMLPRDDSDDVRLFDWSDWRISIAASDLAYMMATHWFPERRRRLETTLLDHYHSVLVAHGVRGYDRARLAADYCLAALVQIMTPVWQCAYELPASIWWPHHERTMLAFDDLGCGELLKPAVRPARTPAASDPRSPD